MCFGVLTPAIDQIKLSLEDRNYFNQTHMSMISWESNAHKSILIRRRLANRSLNTSTRHELNSFNCNVEANRY